MSHTLVTVTYSSTFASIHLSRTYDWFTTHIKTSHATHIKWVMAHTQVTVTYSSTFASVHQSRASLVTLISCVRRRLSSYEWVMSHTWADYTNDSGHTRNILQHTATHCNTLHTNESCHTLEPTIRDWPHTNESCHTNLDESYCCTRRVLFMGWLQLVGSLKL